MFLDLVEFPHDGLRIVLVDAQLRHGAGRAQADIRVVLLAEQLVERLDRLSGRTEPVLSIAQVQDRRSDVT